MSRPKKKKPARQKKPSPKKRKPAKSSISYWTLMIWPVAIILLILFQVYHTQDQRMENQEIKETQTFKELEEKYTAEIQELELQIDLLESQLKIQKEEK